MPAEVPIGSPPGKRLQFRRKVWVRYVFVTTFIYHLSICLPSIIYQFVYLMSIYLSIIYLSTYHLSFIYLLIQCPLMYLSSIYLEDVDIRVTTGTRMVSCREILQRRGLSPELWRTPTLKGHHWRYGLRKKKLWTSLRVKKKAKRMDPWSLREEKQSKI